MQLYGSYSWFFISDRALSKFRCRQFYIINSARHLKLKLENIHMKIQNYIQPKHFPSMFPF